MTSPQQSFPQHQFPQWSHQVSLSLQYEQLFPFLQYSHVSYSRHRSSRRKRSIDPTPFYSAAEMKKIVEQTKAEADQRHSVEMAELEANVKQIADQKVQWWKRKVEWMELECFKVENKAFAPNRISIVSIPSPPIQQIVPLKAAPVQKVEKVQIPSPPIQNIVSLKPHTLQKVKEMRISSTPVQEVIPLKAFPVHRIVTTSVPSQETLVQKVVTFQVAPMHRIVETSIPTVPIQQVVSLQIAPPMKLIASPVSPCTEIVF